MRTTAARLAGLLAAGALSLLGAAAPVSAAPVSAATTAPTPSTATTGKIAQLHVDGDRLEVLFSALGLPPGQSIDPASVEVIVDGESIPATARPVAAASPPAAVHRSAMLVLDVSGSMAGPGLAGAKRAAAGFLAAVPADVKVGLVVVSTTASVAAQPTTDRGRLGSLIESLSAHGDTALYDGTMLALDALGRDGSRTVVLLTDGVDDGSHAGLTAAVAAARESGAVIDAVSLGVAGAQVGPLRQLADATGGRILATTDAADLAAGFTQAARDIATQVFVSATLPASMLSRGNDLSVTVTASAAGSRLTDAAYLPLPPRPTPPATAGDHGPVPAAIDVPWAARGPVLWVALAMLLLGLTPLIAFAIRRAGTREYPQTRVRRRLSFYTLGARRVTGTGDDGDSDAAEAWADAGYDDHRGEPDDAGPLRSALVAAARVTVRGDRERQLGRRLDAAGVPLKPAEWTVVQVATPVSLALLFLLLSAANPVAIIIGLILGAVAPAAYLSVKQSRRTAAFLTQLPETLQLIAGSLSVGHSLPQALDTVVRESTAPMSTEFNRALIENRLGVPLEEALDGVADRMASQDFRWVVMAIRIQREVGGNLSEILATVAATLRERDRLRRQVRVLSAEGRLSAWILGAMPPVFAAYLLMTRPSYVRPLFHDPLGIAMLLIAVGLMVIGVFWLRKVVKVEV